MKRLVERFELNVDVHVSKQLLQGGEPFCTLVDLLAAGTADGALARPFVPQKVHASSALSGESNFPCEMFSLLHRST